MINQDLAEKLNKAFKVGEMSESEQEAFMVRVGNIILESAVLKLLTQLDDANVAALQEYMEDDKDDDIFAYLVKNHPQFEAILEEEVASFQKESLKVVE